MSRRNKVQRKFPKPDPLFNNYLVSMFTNLILTDGKKILAQNIINKTFLLINERTGLKAIQVFEKAIKNVSPNIEMKRARRGGSTYQVPAEISKFRATNLALRWIVQIARKRPGKSISLKLASELIDASKGIGYSIRKKEEMHKMAEANKAFAHIRY
jgi:small subunit ribosomal protein S7